MRFKALASEMEIQDKSKCVRRSQAQAFTYQYIDLSIGKNMRLWYKKGHWSFASADT